jgi:hypothetical protein
LAYQEKKLAFKNPFMQQGSTSFWLQVLESLFGGLGESEQALREYAGAEYDPSSYQQFMDPYQEEVIDQVRRRHILEQRSQWLTYQLELLTSLEAVNQPLDQELD